MTLLEALSAFATALLNRRSEDEIQAAVADLAAAITGPAPAAAPTPAANTSVLS
jgi:hypothetical protein